MSHEQSETIQTKSGKWINVYGRKTKKAGQILPGEREYDTLEEAVEAAKKRSKSYDSAEEAAEYSKKRSKPSDRRGMATLINGYEDD